MANTFEETPSDNFQLAESEWGRRNAEPANPITGPPENRQPVPHLRKLTRAAKPRAARVCGSA